MPHDRTSTPPPATDLDTWLSAFRDELLRLRPNVSIKVANEIGRAEYLPGREPKKAAAAYHTRQGAAPTKGRW
jgi:hypothetical protein